MEWSGVEWSGVEWRGVEWSGVSGVSGESEVDFVVSKSSECASEWVGE